MMALEEIHDLPRLNGKGAAEPGWEPPVPFRDCALPPCPIDVLPPWLAAWAAAEAEALQVPPDLPALLGLAVVGLAAAKKIEVQVCPGWREPVNIYAVVALAPGEGKSPVFRDAMAPVTAFERSERARLAPVLAVARARADLALERVKICKQAAAKAKDHERAKAEQDLDAAVAQADGIRVPAELRLTADDATPEALGVVLAQQGGRLGVFSSEGGPLEIIAGRYSNSGAPNMDLFLKAHAGDSYVLDRIGRPGNNLASPALTVALTVQPDVIAGLSSNPGFRGRGLLARFLYAIPKSRVGSRIAAPAPVPEHVRGNYDRCVTMLLRLPEQRDEQQEIRAGVIELDMSARARLVEFKAALEPRLGAHGDLAAIADWANKLAGHVARLAALLHVGDHADVEDQLDGVIDASTVERAVRIAEYLVAHALAAFDAMGADPAVEDAKHVLSWIKRTTKTEVSKREIHRGNAHRLRSAAALAPVLELLVDRGYLRERLPEARGPGRPGGPVYEVNPVEPAAALASDGGSSVSSVSRSARRAAGEFS